MKKLLSILLAALLLVSLVGCNGEENPGSSTPDAQAGQDNPSQTEQTAEPTAPPITWMTFPADRALTAQQYFVFNCETGLFLTISGPEDERIYPASVTKLFTAYIANQYLQPDRQITAGDALDMIYPGSSVAELEKGDTVTTERLVEGMLLPSGNDAAYVLAVEAGRLLGDSEASAADATAVFVAEMNAQAKLLGMTATHFANPDGIHEDDHYTTFHDLAILGSLALEDPVLMRYAHVASDTVTLTGGTKEWKNTNALLHEDSEYYCPYAIGLKTGQTPSAGSCLLSAFEYDGTTLVIGVFGCPEVEDRFADTLQLFNRTISQLNP